jgi:hypothetical protein
VVAVRVAPEEASGFWFWAHTRKLYCVAGFNPDNVKVFVPAATNVPEAQSAGAAEPAVYLTKCPAVELAPAVQAKLKPVVVSELAASEVGFVGESWSVVAVAVTPFEMPGVGLLFLLQMRNEYCESTFSEVKETEFAAMALSATCVPSMQLAGAAAPVA